MPEAAADTATETTTDITPTDVGDVQAPDTGDLAAELEKWKAQARKHEQRAKANADAAKELEQLRQSTMSDQERAIAEARAAARAETISELASEVVDARIAEQAAGRLSPEQIATLTTGLNRAKFLDAETGKVDVEAVAAFVDGIAPHPTGPRPIDLGQGTRNQTPALNSDALEQMVRRAIGA